MNFKVGDVVQLTCGGPLMTVVSTPDPGSKSYNCVWFIEGKPTSYHFPGAALKLYE